MQAALMACNRCASPRPPGTYAVLRFISATLLRSGGNVCLVGMGNSSTMRLPLSAAATKEVDIIGSFRYASACLPMPFLRRSPAAASAANAHAPPMCSWPADTYPLCISLMSSKRVNVLPLVTHRFGWSASQLLAGFEAAASGKAIKVMFTGLAERAQM